MAAKINPFDTLLQMAGGYCLPRCLHVVADLGVADALDETPRTASDLAASVGAHPDALSRVLRLLAAHNQGASLNSTFVFGRKPFSACPPVAAENVVEFAGKKHGLQSSIRPGIFAARSRLAFRGLARLMRRSSGWRFSYG